MESSLTGSVDVTLEPVRPFVVPLPLPWLSKLCFALLIILFEGEEEGGVLRDCVTIFTPVERYATASPVLVLEFRARESVAAARQASAFTRSRFVSLTLPWDVTAGVTVGFAYILKELTLPGVTMAELPL